MCVAIRTVSGEVTFPALGADQVRVVQVLSAETVVEFQAFAFSGFVQTLEVLFVSGGLVAGMNQGWTCNLVWCRPAETYTTVRNTGCRCQ
jgi:hypothetical protein